MRPLPLLALALALTGCPPTVEPDPTFCTDLMETDGCLTEENLPECEAANDECPGEVLVMESCPLQFGCP